MINISTIIKDQSKLNYAIAYARRLNWPVFPLHTIANGKCTCLEGIECKTPGKHPRIRDWYKEATTDEKKIMHWWGMWPNSNIGIPMGKKSGIIAVDVDPRNGGGESLDRLLAEYGKLPETVEAITGGGGQHILFKYPGEVKSHLDGYEGIDIQSTGKLIVVAPSVHQSGNRYEWELSSMPTETPLADIPEWLFSLIKAEFSKQIEVKPTEEYLKILDGVSQGGRNNTVATLTGYFLGKKIDYQIAYKLVMMWNQFNDPPLDGDEVTKTFNSILEKEATKRKRGLGDGRKVKSRSRK